MAANTPEKPQDTATAGSAPTMPVPPVMSVVKPKAPQRRRKQPTQLNSKTSPEAIERLERDLECVNLRRAGVEWHAIASQLGYADASHAHHRFMALMKAYPREQIDEARQIELERLDRVQLAIWEQCLSEGKNQHWAIDRFLKLSDQRARLLGINAPVRQEITVLSESTVDKAIRELQAAMQAQAAEAGLDVPAE